MFATFLAIVACGAWPNWRAARRSSLATACGEAGARQTAPVGTADPARWRSRDRVDRNRICARPRQGWQRRSAENDAHGSGDRRGRTDGRHRILCQPHTPRGHTEALRGHVGCPDRVRVGTWNVADAGTSGGAPRPGGRRGLNGVFRRSRADRQGGRRRNGCRGFARAIAAAHDRDRPFAHLAATRSCSEHAISNVCISMSGTPSISRWRGSTTLIPSRSSARPSSPSSPTVSGWDRAPS